MGWNWCRYGIWRKKTYWCNQLYILFPCLPAALSRMVSHPAQPENIDQISKIISRSRSHLSHFVVDRRSQPQISHQVEHLWGKRRNHQWIKFCRTGINKIFAPHLFLFGLNVHPVQDCLHHHVTQGDRVDKLQSRKPGERRILMLKRKREGE